MRNITFLSTLFALLFMVGCSQTTPTYDGTIKEEAKKRKRCSKKIVKKKPIKEKKFVTYTYKRDFPVTVRKISYDPKGDAQ